MTHLEEVQQAIRACRDGERPKDAARRADVALSRIRRNYPDRWVELTANQGCDIAYLLNPYAADAERRLVALQSIATWLLILND